MLSTTLKYLSQRPISAMLRALLLLALVAAPVTGWPSQLLSGASTLSGARLDVLPGTNVCLAAPLQHVCLETSHSCP